MTSVLPIAAAATFIGIALATTFPRAHSKTPSWLIPASFCALFFGFSLFAVLSEGALGFWPEHTRNLWGNQIWFDLLLSLGVGWFLIVPRAREHRMNLLAWLALIVCTGSIGFLAMFARLHYLQNNAIASTPK